MKPTHWLLFIPLAWSTCGLADTAPSQSPAAGSWRQAPTSDAAGTMTFTRYTLLGKFSASPRGQPDRPALAVDCLSAAESHASKGRFLAANLLVGIPVRIVYVEPEEIHGMSYLPKVAVVLRANAGNNDEEQWPVGADKSSAAVPKDALKTILHARTVEITAADDHGAPIKMTFDIPQSDFVENGCNVDEHKG